MKETLKLGLTLLIISVVSAGILAFSNEATKGKIAELKMEKSLGSLKEIYGDSAEFEMIEKKDLGEDDRIVEAFQVKDGSGYAIKHITKGFNGDIVMLTGFNSDGEVVGVRLLEHGETKGIGSRAGEPEFLDLFIGETADSESGVDTLSGATVSSKAVLAGMKDVKEIYNTNFGN